MKTPPIRGTARSPQLRALTEKLNASGSLRETVEEHERIARQSPIDPTPPAIIRTGEGDELSISQAARQLQKQRKDDVFNVVIWGAEAIAPYLGRTTKGAFGALESGKVPGAKKIAGRWGLSLKVFLASFENHA